MPSDTLAKPSYNAFGTTFTLLPTTTANRRRVASILQEFHAWEVDLQRRSREFRDEVDKWGRGERDTPPESSEFFPESDDERDSRVWYDVFKAITSGDHSRLVFEDFDEHLAVQALADFLLPHERYALAASGVLPITL